MIIDIHNHLGTSPDGGVGTVESLLSIMEECRVERAVLFAIDEDNRGPTFSDLNNKVLQAQKDVPGVLFGFARIDASAGSKAVDEFKRCCDLGIKGLKLKASDGFEPEESMGVIATIKDNKLPVLFHSSHEKGSRPEDWEPIIREFSNINFILAHGAKDDYRKAAEIAKKCPNLYIETSALSLHRTKVIFEQVGSKQMIFGSDTPYSHPKIELSKYEIIVENQEELNDIFYKNAEKIINFT